MELLGKYNMQDSLKLVFLLKFFTFMFLIWNLKNYVCRFCKDIETEFKHYRSSNTSFNRLLARHEYNEELDDLNLGGNLVDYKTSPNMNNEEDATSTYGYLKRRKPINLLSYKKDYEHRYYRKKGLAKLDCYYEKKIFDKIDHIHVLSKCMRNDKKLLRKELFNKFGSSFILFFLVTIFLLIKPILDNEYLQILPKCFFDCTETQHKKNTSGDYEHNDDNFPRNIFKKSTWEGITYVNTVFLCLLLFFVITVFIYILIKYKKYKKLKGCRNKTSV